MPSLPFNSLYRHGFARVSVCVPRVRVADPAFNVAQTLELAKEAAADHAAVALFPELGLSAYSNDDLFHQDALLAGVLGGIQQLLEGTRSLQTLVMVGAPLRLHNALFNCAICLCGGRVLGVVPKTFLPNYREFYEKRQFTSGAAAHFNSISLLGQEVPFGTNLLFAADDVPGLVAGVEICEDLWTPIPPSTFAALAGATVLCNLSASNITIGKAGYRRELCASQSSKCLSAYLYSAAGFGESTTDLAWDGHALIYENGTPLSESERFSDAPQRISADLDLDRLAQERMRLTSFNDTIALHRERLAGFRRISFRVDPPDKPLPLRRWTSRFPYVPLDQASWDRRCSEVYHIQVSSLQKRLEAAGIRKVVIGVSGGLDSTHALTVACRTMDRLGLPRSHVLAYTMPGFATGETTRANAWALMKALDVSGQEIDIRASCLQMLKDLQHPFARGEAVHDVTFENVQAGERTSHLFRLANLHQALVLGTGDLSELALGWCTYGVGDQMSHYNVNTSVPKTLIQHLIRWEATRGEFSADTGAILHRILNTEISPELIPAAAGKPVQSSQATVGPYELQDFHLYYLTRYGYLPSKVAFLSHHAWGSGKDDPGAYPPGFPADGRRDYTLEEIKGWLRVFLRRFFAQSQFKRSAMPNGPKVGSGGSLSPRSDWRAPSDSSADAWLDELERNVPG